MRLALLLVLSVIAAGCAAPPGPDVPAAAPAAVLAAPCDDARAALAHLGNGTFGLAPAAMCVFGTKLVGSENTLGICRKTGAVYAGMAFSGNIGGLARSLDGGASWEYVEPALAGQKPHATTLDPYVYVDPVTCRVFLDNLLTVNCSLLSWSDDAGETWSHSAAGCGEFDHQSLFAGPPVRSATVGYPHVVYRCAIHAVALAGASTSTTCQRSLDGGLTWLPPGAPAYGPNPFGRGHNGVMGACDGAAGHGIVDAQGRVYLPKGWCGQPWLAWSDDEGLTWTRAQVAGLGMAAGADGGVDHEAAVDADAAGNLYYAWVAADRLPYLVVSADRGASWSEPIALAPPGLLAAALPALAATPDGRVGVSYYGSYDAPPAASVPPCETDLTGCSGRALFPPPTVRSTWSGHVALVVDALGEPRVWTATTGERPLVRGECGPIRCQKAYDFQDVQMAADGAAWATFVDVEGGQELLVARLG